MPCVPLAGTSPAASPRHEVPWDFSMSSHKKVKFKPASDHTAVGNTMLSTLRTPRALGVPGNQMRPGAGGGGGTTLPAPWPWRPPPNRHRPAPASTLDLNKPGHHCFNHSVCSVAEWSK